MNCKVNCKMLNSVSRAVSSRLLAASLYFLLAAGLAGSPALAQGPPPAKVAVDQVTRAAVRETTVLIGTVEAFQTSTVASVVSARAEKLLVRTGDRVKKDAPLLLLDTTLTGADLRQSEARAEAARVQVAQDEADLAMARKLLPEEAVSTDLVAARERNVSRSRQELAQSAADVERLTYLMENATVRAPFSGVVVAELAQAGEWVPVGGGIVRLVDLSTVRVVVWVPENVVGRLTTGDTVTVHTEAGQVSGTIHSVTPEGDPKSRTFPVEIRIGNRNGHLFAGMLARVNFAVGQPEQVLTVPKDAVVTRGDSSHLWKVVEGSAVRVPVTVGREGERGRVEVTPMGELKPGDTVITRGNERVRDGQAVEVAE